MAHANRERSLTELLDAKLARYVQWEKPLRRARGQKMRRVAEGAVTWEAFDRELAELERQLRAAYDPWNDLHPLFEQLCTAYVAGDDAERAALRAFVAERRTLGELLWRSANGLARQIRDAGDAPLVERALAAVSLENCASDYRDTLMTLADVYAAALDAGLDPGAAFAAAAERATDEPTRGGCASLARTLREFHASSVLRERRSQASPYGGPA